jgi:hypothetical protein
VNPISDVRDISRIAYGFMASKVLYHGVLAPHARTRAQVVRYGRPAADPHTPEVDASPRPHTPGAWTWPALMRRVFDLDVLACPRCGGRLRVVAIVPDPAVVRTLLTHLGRARSTEAPGPAPPAPAAIGSTPRSAPDPRGVPLAGAPPPHPSPPPSTLDREPAPAQDASGSASDREADPTRRAGPGAR